MKNINTTFKAISINIQAYIVTINIIRNLIIKLQWMKKGQTVRQYCGIGIQLLPKHYSFRYIDVFKRFQCSFWVLGFWIDLPRPFEIKDTKNPWYYDKSFIHGDYLK